MTFDAARLVKGANAITFSRASAPSGSNNTGMGWDTVKLAVAPGEVWRAEGRE